MKNFGILKGKELDWSNEAVKGELLVELNLCNRTLIASGTGRDIENGLLTLKYNPNVIYINPTKEFVNEFYEFSILNVFRVTILEHKLNYFKRFNAKIYGQSGKKQKQIALEDFNGIYIEIYEEAITFFENNVSENGIEHNLNFGKLKNLYHQHEAYKQNVFNKISAKEYLIGEESFFTIANLYTNYDIQKELEFEIQLQIMVELNDRFGFEEDLYFTKNSFLKKQFELNQHIFFEFETYKYTHNKIESFKEDRKAKTESLYAALIKKNLITDNRDKFLIYLSDIHNLQMSKIRKYEKEINYKHNERISKFCEEIENLTVKKE